MGTEQDWELCRTLVCSHFHVLRSDEHLKRCSSIQFATIPGYRTEIDSDEARRGTIRTGSAQGVLSMRQNHLLPQHPPETSQHVQLREACSRMTENDVLGSDVEDAPHPCHLVQAAGASHQSTSLAQSCKQSLSCAAPRGLQSQQARLAAEHMEMNAVCTMAPCARTAGMFGRAIEGLRTCNTRYAYSTVVRNGVLYDILLAL